MITPPVGVKPILGVDRFAALDRGHARAIAEMGNHETVLSDRWQVDAQSIRTRGRETRTADIPSDCSSRYL